MNAPRPDVKRIVILGGGFGGVYTAMYLEKLLKRREDVELVLVNKENYFVFQPMLAEIVSGNVGILDTVNPINRLLPRTKLFIREVEEINLEERAVTLSPGFWPRPLVLFYDHLVLALGTVTDFRNIPGLHEHALPFKYLADAIRLRNHVIHVLQEASIESDRARREQLLTFVVAGGGFSGVECAAELNGFVREVAKEYGMKKDDPRVILLHAGNRILEREMPEHLSRYAQGVLVERGLELQLNKRLHTATPDSAVLADGSRIATKTLVSTVPSSPNPLIEPLKLPKDRGKIIVDKFFEIEGFPDVSALGDCCLLPDPSGEGFCPPTAQHAIREGKTLAHNIAAKMFGGERAPFTFKGLGKMGSLGGHRAVAEMFGFIRLGRRVLGVFDTGILAWFLWRTVYWWKLPGFSRKMKVGLSWLLDLIFKPDTVQLNLGGSKAISQLHFESGETIFRQGDIGDSLYIILEGEADVVVEHNGSEKTVARLKAGEYFGEMALLKERTRTATIRCVTPMNLLALGQGDFQALVANLPDLKKSFQGVSDTRSDQLQALNQPVSTDVAVGAATADRVESTDSQEHS